MKKSKKGLRSSHRTKSGGVCSGRRGEDRQPTHARLELGLTARIGWESGEV